MRTHTIGTEGLNARDWSSIQQCLVLSLHLVKQAGLQGMEVGQ